MQTTLAQSTSETLGVRTFQAFTDRLDILNHPTELLDALAHLPLITAAVIVVVGALCVLNGYRWHKWVIVVLAFLGGLALGRLLSEEFGKSRVVAIAVGLLCAIIATPLLKIAVAIFGGLTGAFIGANVWTALEASPADGQWAGAAMGAIVLAMASLIVFRLVIVLFTSVGGAAMVVFGLITLSLHVPSWEPAIRESLSSHHLLIPLLVGIAAVSGFVLQESRLRSTKAQTSQ
jgi:hypothetical protein